MKPTSVVEVKILVGLDYHYRQWPDRPNQRHAPALSGQSTLLISDMMMVVGQLGHGKPSSEVA